MAIRNRKLDQLATIINGMFNGEGPDLLGVCEVEDETVLGSLNQGGFSDHFPIAVVVRSA